jgi:uncharacterized protein YcbK (DUF882 family)
MTSHLIPPDRADARWSYKRAIVVGVIAIVVVAVLVTFPPSKLLGTVFGGEPARPPVSLAPSARGRSGEVRLQLKLPGEPFEFPMQLQLNTSAPRYQWVRASDSAAVEPDTELVGAGVRSPKRSGLFHLAVIADGKRTIVSEILVAVLVPFSEKLGSSLNGYRIGTYRWERARGDATPPPLGFVEVWADDAPLWVSNHLQLADFITHDAQQEQWPKYLALDRRILDKIELVLDRLGARERILTVNVHSGFRTPLHNRRVPRAAGDSRHQYGDAIDLAMDADQDGRVSYFDILAMARAVELVERDYPELVGGMGVYGNRGVAPYVHIDVRGERKRWRG